MKTVVVDLVMMILLIWLRETRLYARLLARDTSLMPGYCIPDADIRRLILPDTFWLRPSR